MSSVRVRLLLSKFDGDEIPVICGAIDETIWEHMEQADEDAWVKECQQRYGLDPTDCEWAQARAVFPALELAAAFNAVTVAGAIEQESA